VTTVVRVNVVWRRVAVLTITIIFLWGGGILAIANALSGSFSAKDWVRLVAVWHVVPLLISSTLMLYGRSLINSGSTRSGLLVACFPLAGLAVLALFAVLFG
jgi:hypothetical protein